MKQTSCHAYKQMSASLSLKLTEKVPVREIYVESEEQSADASITNSDQFNNVPESEQLSQHLFTTACRKLDFMNSILNKNEKMEMK